MLNFDIYDLNEFVDRHNLKPSSATATITLFNLIIQTVRSIECKTKDTDNILGKIDWFLRNPDFIVYDNFVKCFELDTHHSSRDTDHSSYSFYPNQRAVFSSLVLHLVHKALARHHAKPIPESTPSLFTPVPYDEIPPDQAERLAYICGWVLMRSRQNMKCSSELIAHLGHDEQCKDNGKFYVKPNIPCLKFFHCLSNFIFGRLNMDRCHEQTSQLANLVTAEVQSNHALHSHFRDLFPPHLCSQSITLLLQEMTQLTMKSAINQFLSDNSLKPKKQSFALRVTLAIQSQSTSTESSSASSSSVCKQNSKRKSKTRNKTAKRKKNDCVTTKCKKQTEDWVACDSCDGWFHQQCVGLTKSTIPEGDWFCNMCVNES